MAETLTVLENELLRIATCRATDVLELGFHRPHLRFPPKAGEKGRERAAARVLFFAVDLYRPRMGRSLLVLAATLAMASQVAADCRDYSTAATESGSYWSSVAGCSPCVQAGCSYCVATFTCSETGSEEGAACAPEDRVVADAGQCPGT
jgi:hypothetical protein